MAAREGLLERAGAKLVQAIRTWPSPPVWRNSPWTETVLVSRRSPWPISVLVSTWRAKATKRSASSSATVPRSPGGQDASFSRNATVSALAGDRAPALPACPGRNDAVRESPFVSRQVHVSSLRLADRADCVTAVVHSFYMGADPITTRRLSAYFRKGILLPATFLSKLLTPNGSSRVSGAGLIRNDSPIRSKLRNIALRNHFAWS